MSFSNSYSIPNGNVIFMPHIDFIPSHRQYIATNNTGTIHAASLIGIQTVILFTSQIISECTEGSFAIDVNEKEVEWVKQKLIESVTRGSTFYIS